MAPVSAPAATSPTEPPRLLLHARWLLIRLPEEAQPRAFTAPQPPGFAPPIRTHLGGLSRTHAAC